MWSGESLFQNRGRAEAEARKSNSRPAWAQSWSAEAAQRAGQDPSFQPLRQSHQDKGPVQTMDTPAEGFSIPAHRRGGSGASFLPQETGLGQNDGSLANTPPLEHGACTQIKSPRPVESPMRTKAAAPKLAVPVTVEANPLPPRNKPRARRTTVDMSRANSSPRPSARAMDGGIVKMGRREAWARFLAYEACMQLCLQSGPKCREAQMFLGERCNALRDAFEFTHLLLKPATKETPEIGATIAWHALLLWDDSEMVLPKLGFGPQTMRTSVVRVTVARMSSHDPRLPIHPSGVNPLYVCMRPRSSDVQWHFTEVENTGRGKVVDPLEVRTADMHHELVLEIRNAQGVLASGTLSASDLWKVASNQYTMDVGKAPKKKGLIGLISNFCNTGRPSDDDSFGKRWVELYDPRGGSRAMASVLLSAWIAQQETTFMAAAPMTGNTLPEGSSHDQGGTANSGQQQISAWQVYDLTLMAAINALDCGPRKLEPLGEWKWLLAQFASAHGIRPSYAVLTHMRWVMRPENATATADCLKLLCTSLGPLEKMQTEGTLLQQETAILKRLEEDCEELLARCFENYYALSENAPGGILDGGVGAAESPAPALAPAVELSALMRAVLQPVDHQWMTERFRIAAGNRYRRLAAACDDQLPFSREAKAAQAADPSSPAPAMHEGQLGLENDAEVAYARLGALSQAIKNELQNDLKIHDAAILPAFCNLPQITAAEYSTEFLVKLVNSLAQFPPPQPTQPAVDLMVTLGQQQEYFSWHNLLPPAGHPGSLDALKVFGPYVQQWIDGSQDALCHRCKVLEASTFAATVNADMPHEEGRALVAPLVEEMLARLDAEILRYERVIQYWPVFGPLLEGAVCAVLRESTAAVARQCGLSQVHHNHNPQGPHRRQASAQRLGSPTRDRGWRWAAAQPVGPGSYAALQPHEAVLLNSFKRLLAVVPQTEHKLSHWAGGALPSQAPPTPHTGPPSAQHRPESALASPHAGGAREYAGPGVEITLGGGMGPSLGAQFAQAVKEVRSAYAGAVTSCAERIAGAVFSAHSITALLQQHRLSPEPSAMSAQLEPALVALEEVMQSLRQVLDARVFVSLGRGLWDCTAREVFDYTEELQEEHHKDAWRGRQNASAALGVVDNVFTSIISSALRHDVQSKDLDLPWHSARAHDLLADNTAAVNLSYTVY
ncbi:hypothetical protein WJX73_010312 [Symbiochloris irregularis]|uniref:Uncharacterized protein n=1 Tax=Symbiochloris irregularis TaxID=706552 RepID=A0AAW1P9M0_9CHLO